MKKAWKWAGIALAVIVLVTVSFITWAEFTSGPGESALAALKSDDKVTVTNHGGYITFEPNGVASTTGFIFYPGGRVEYRSYAPILHRIAAQGYFVALVPVKLNLAFFEIEAGAPLLKDFPQIKVWAVGGHSLGGVAASFFAQNHPEIKGLVFLASYPPDEKLKDSGVKMLSIYGTNDGLATSDKIEQFKSYEPADTVFVVIEGGNHAQFGDYGYQPGDNPAAIPAKIQWDQAAQATATFLQFLNR